MASADTVSRVASQAAEGLSGAGSVQGVVTTLPASKAGAAVLESSSGNATLPLTSPAAAADAAQPLAQEGAAAVEGASQALGAAAQSAGQSMNALAGSAPADSVFSWSGYFQAIGTLLLLLALIWFLVWAVRKYGKFNFLPQAGSFPRHGLRMEAQLPLGPRKGLMVVRFLNKRLLLGVTDQQITLLKEVGDHDEEDSLEFKEVMEAATRQKTDS